jgi:hypothetical protein
MFDSCRCQRLRHRIGIRLVCQEPLARACRDKFPPFQLGSSLNNNEAKDSEGAGTRGARKNNDPTLHHVNHMTVNIKHLRQS